MTAPTKSRYSWGGDEHLVVQLAEEMSLAANFTVMAIAKQLEARKIDGVIDICPANASFLVRFDPDRSRRPRWRPRCARWSRRSATPRR